MACSVCGATDHRIQRCPTNAAKIIRGLKRQLRGVKLRKKFRRKPGRSSPKAHGEAKGFAREKYTKIPRQDRRKVARRLTVKERRGAGLVGTVGCNHSNGLERLRAAKYVNIPTHCCHCNQELCEPVERGDGHFHVRCSTYRCPGNSRQSVLNFSPFKGCRLPVGKVALITQQYTNSDNIRPPADDQMAGDAEVSRTAVANIIQVLLNKEVAVAQRSSRRGQVGGDLEIDEKSVRSYHVSTSNPLFEKYKTAALRRGNHRYYISFLRVVGMRQRGAGKVFIYVLPPKLLPPGSSPPPISESEVRQCGLLRRAKPKSSVVHSDGAPNYKKVISTSFKKLRSRQVSHTRLEWVKSIPAVKLRGGRSSTLSGTQAIDSTWKSLDKSISSEIATKRNHDVNPRLVEYIWRWVYRINLRNKDGFLALGEAFAKDAL